MAQYDTSKWPEVGTILLKEIRELKGVMETMSAKLDRAENNANQALKQVADVNQTVQTLKLENNNLKGKVLALELYTRKNNLIFFNVRESAKESTDQLYKKISEELKKVGLCLDDFPIDNLHRLPKPDDSTRPRPVIIKFVSYLDKEMIWKAHFDLKKFGSNLYIKEHVPVEIENKLKQLEPIRKAAKLQGFRAKIVVDKLMINSQAYTVETLHQLPAALQPQNIAVREIDDFVFFFSKETCLSNFHPAHFTHKGNTYTSSEQFLHHAKAELFGDSVTAQKIMQCTSPAKTKHLGSTVKNFSHEKWIECAFNIMVEGLEQKFIQNPDMSEFLKSTMNKQLVEAAPRDDFWGIGKSLFDKHLTNNPSSWGQNMMGKALEKVREKLM